MYTMYTVIKTKDYGKALPLKYNYPSLVQFDLPEKM
jgi:hypothetical protein